MNLLTGDSVRLPQGGAKIIEKLNQAGYEAWFVGGCVRDLLLGLQPHDWDICTSALPVQTEQVLSDFRIHETGIQHGTVLVMADGAGYEVTTFRRESGYSDHRHPDSVAFVSDLKSDLARRDFTINAMAYHPSLGLCDEFGGREDLSAGILRTVGAPIERFGEDALRILRALRFAARFDLTIETQTAAAIHDCGADLEHIARERIFSELKKLLCAAQPQQILLEYSDVIGIILPELKPCFGFAQNNPYHCYDVWTHCVYAVGKTPADSTLRLAALFHDVGKPHCETRDAAGISHFYGHADISAELCERMLRSLKCDNQTRERVTLLVKYHDRQLPSALPSVRRWLGKLGERNISALLQLRRADILAQAELGRTEKLADLDRFAALVEQVLHDTPCWSLKQLAVNGADLQACGVPKGPEIGRLLQRALNAVMEDGVENSREALLQYLKLN